MLKLAAAQRQGHDGVRRADAGQRAQARQQLIEKREARGILRVARVRQRQLERERLLGFETGIDRLQADKAPDQQTRAGEQHDGQRQFDDDQRAAKARAAAAGHGPASALLQRGGEPAARRVERRHQAEENPRQHGDTRM